jgi:hypothetical protein
VLIVSDFEVSIDNMHDGEVIQEEAEEINTAATSIGNNEVIH